LIKNKKEGETMFRILGNFFSKIAKKYLPDAFIFAILLTLVVLILGMAAEGKSFIDMTEYWGKGFWNLLAFAMQMILILITGNALATSKPIHAAMKALASATNSPFKAIMITTFVMTFGSFLNWGFGLIIGALLAKEMAKDVKGIHYPLLVASAYSGFIVWHAGLSGSIPLKVAGKDMIMNKFADGAVLATTDTIFTWWNLLIVAIFLITIPIINALMMPKNKEDIIEVDPSIFEEHEIEVPLSKKDMVPAERIENSWILSVIIGALGVVYIVYFFSKGGTLGLNIVIFIFMIGGIFMHKTPINYVKSITEAIRSTGGIALQFPFYAGIMGMMIHSGLAASISQWFVDISTPVTFPFFTFLSAGVVNMFVPSGGGQWVVQGPIVMPAAKALGVPLGKAAMSIAWGDAWTNMVQPFWALPLLGIAKLGIRDIMGYTTVILIYSGIVTSIFLMIV